MDQPNVLPASVAKFFPVPLKREKIPVWFFKPESPADGHAGLILNMSQSELRVLTNAELPLTSVLYDIDLLLEEGHGVASFKGQARLLWSRPANQLSMVLSSWSDFRKQRKPS